MNFLLMFVAAITLTLFGLWRMSTAILTLNTLFVLIGFAWMAYSADRFYLEALRLRETLRCVRDFVGFSSMDTNVL